MSSYLSIDLDYFTTVTSRGTHVFDDQKDYHKFFNTIFTKNIPVLLVDSHEMILDHVNSFPSDILYNMDYHNDVFPVCTMDLKHGYGLECGSWGNFVSWRKDGTFIWCLPDFDECWVYGYGDCNLGDTGYKSNPRLFNSRKPYSKTIVRDALWKDYRIYRKLPNLKDVQAVGICMSVGFVNPGDLDFLSGIFTKAYEDGRICLGEDVSKQKFYDYFLPYEEVAL